MKYYVLVITSVIISDPQKGVHRVPKGTAGEITSDSEGVQ